MKNIRKTLPVVIAIITFSFVGCSDLEEKLEDSLTLEQVEESTAGETPDVSGLLIEVYNSLNDIHGDGDHLISAHVGDLYMAPTRGGG